MSCDMIKLQLSQHLSRDKNILSRDTNFMSRRNDIIFLSRDTNFMSRRNDIMLQHLYIKELQYMHFQFDYLCSVTTYEIIFCCCRLVYYKTLIL